MQKGKLFYPILLLYELLRLGLLLADSIPAVPSSNRLALFAAIPLLCILPPLVYMLILDERRFAAWLILIIWIKALSLPVWLWFILSSTGGVLAPNPLQDVSLLATLATAVLLLAGDFISGITCYRRHSRLCM